MDMHNHRYVCKTCHTDYALLPNSSLCSKQITSYTGLSLKVYSSESNFVPQNDPLVLDANFAVNGYAKFENTARGKVKIVGANVQLIWRTNFAENLTKKIGDFTLVHPFAHEDRGIYLNGRDNMLELTELTLFHTFTISTWLRSRGGGLIFSSSDDTQPFFSFSIEHNSIRVGSAAHKTDFRQHVGNETWKSLSLAVEYVEES